MTPTRDDIRIRLLAEVVQPLLGPADSADEQTVLDDILRIVAECGFVWLAPVTCPTCEGEGQHTPEHDNATGYICPACGGRGVVPPDNIIEQIANELDRWFDDTDTPPVAVAVYWTLIERTDT